MFNRFLTTLRNLRISLKLGLGFGVLVFLTILVGTVAFVASSIEDNALQQANLAEREVNLIEQTDISFLEARTFELQFLAAYPEQGFDAAYNDYVLPHQQRMDEAFATLTEARAVLEQQTRTDVSALVAELDTLETTLNTYNTAFLSEVDQVRDGGQATPARFQAPAEEVAPLVTTIVEAEQNEASLALAAFEQTQRTAFIVELILLISSAVVGAGLAYGITRQITGQVDELENVFKAVGVGDFDARAEVLSQDEIGRTAENVNIMIQRLTELLQQANEDRERLQQAVQRLVSDVAGLAAGDLSIRVTDDDEMTGEIGQALNFAINELNQIVYGVEVAADEMTHAQSTMNQTVNLMVQQAGTSAELAEQAATTADEGDRAVSETIGAMERIRDNTQETARRIKRLGEVSQEISSAVRLIEEIADRTTVLALNASIQAAAAGEAGRGFAVVAEEVQRLAERATSATRDIEAMVKGIQTETSEAVYVIEEATREVVDGSQRAQAAGAHMGELNELVDRLAALVQHVADTTAGQINDSLGDLTSVSGELQASVQALRAAPPAEVPASGD